MDLFDGVACPLNKLTADLLTFVSQKTCSLWKAAQSKMWSSQPRASQTSQDLLSFDLLSPTFSWPTSCSVIQTPIQSRSAELYLDQSSPFDLQFKRNMKYLLPFIDHILYFAKCREHNDEGNMIPAFERIPKCINQSAIIVLSHSIPLWSMIIFPKLLGPKASVFPKIVSQPLVGQWVIHSITCVICFCFKKTASKGTPSTFAFVYWLVLTLHDK